MSIKNKVSDSVYEIYVESYPDKSKRKVYRGDYFTHTLIGFNNDDSPFDFSVYDIFKAQLRFKQPFGDDTPDHEFSDSDFVLGKKNSTSSIKDELHLTSEDAMDVMMDSKYKQAWLDIQGDLNGEIKTFIKMRLRIETDITK